MRPPLVLRCALTCAALVLLARSASAQSWATARQVTRLEGAVTEFLAGIPVPSARVTLFEPGLSFFQETRTLPDGAFALTNLPPGAFRFGVALPKGVPTSTQERAYTSPIWYTPES